MNDSRAAKVKAIFARKKNVNGTDRAYALKVAGYTQRQIATGLGVTPETVHQVLHDRITSRRVANYVSDAIGLPTDTVWPSGRYRRAQLRVKNPKG